MRRDPARSPQPVKAWRSSRTWCALAAAAGLAALAAGCGGATVTGGGTVTSTVTIAAVPGVADASIYLAQKDNLFAADGLKNVVIKSYPTQAAVLSALRSGQADIAASDYGDLFYQQVKSGDLRILADGYDATPGAVEVLTYPGSPIKSPVNLANTTVGLPSDSVVTALKSSGYPVSLDAAAATSVLEDYLGNAASSVQWKPMPQPQEVSELEHHRIQAILVTEPYIYQAESEGGALEVLDAFSGSTAGLPMLGYAAMNSWVHGNDAAVADFQAAMSKAQSQAAITGHVQTLLPKATGMTAQDAELITVGSYPASTSIQALDQVVLLMTNTYMIKLDQAPDVGTMVVRPKG